MYYGVPGADSHCKTILSGHSAPQTNSRPQYSRLKRFIEYIRTFKSDSLSINLEPILDLFYLLENGWHKNKYGRTYFYCKNIVLHALILQLGITDVLVPLLKDDTRNTKQLAEIVIIINGETK